MKQIDTQAFLIEHGYVEPCCVILDTAGGDKQIDSSISRKVKLTAVVDLLFTPFSCLDISRLNSGNLLFIGATLPRTDLSVVNGSSQMIVQIFTNSKFRSSRYLCRVSPTGQVKEGYMVCEVNSFKEGENMDIDGEFTKATGDICKEDLLSFIDVSISIELGQFEMNCHDLLNLKKGELVHFEFPVDKQVSLRIGEEVIAKAKFVNVDGSVALQVTEIEDGDSV